MKISYNVTGKERKALVTAISEIKDEPLTYKGAPTFAYEIGWWRVDKDGTVENTAPATRPCAEELIDGLVERGFTATSTDWAEFEDEAEGYADHEMKRLKLENENVPDHSNRGQYGGDDISGADHLTLEFPLEGFTPEAVENLTKMVAAKQTILKAALGTESLEIPQAGETLKFPWFTLESPDEAAYYVQFVWALCTAAKEKKRITAKERGVVDNPKYAMRCWLLSLGLIGEEYKNARKLLLSRLDGNSSFKGGTRPTYTANCYTYPNGEEGEAMDCASEEFTSLAKAKAHIDAFAESTGGIYFAGAHVEDESGKYVYELLVD